jgi:uncharacterized protein (DUF4415 family)
MNNNFDEKIIDNETEFKERFKKVPRPNFLNKFGKPKETKNRITISLDADILEFFKERASQKGSLPYQTQINNELRKVMENLKQNRGEVITMDMLDNPNFIATLADKSA